MDILFNSIKVLIIFFFVSFHVTGNAQTLEINRSTTQYKDGTVPTVHVALDPESKEVKKAWKDFMDNQFNIKIKGIGFLVNKDILEAEKANLSSISERPINLFTKIVESNGVTQMNVFVSLSDGKYIGPDSNPKKFATLKQITESFLAEYLPTYYESKLSEEKEDLEDIRDEVADIKKEITDARSEIDDKYKAIDKLEKKIKKNEDDLKGLETKLKERQDRVSEQEEAWKRVREKLEQVRA